MKATYETAVPANTDLNVAWIEKNRYEAKKSAATQGITTLWEISSSIGNSTINESQADLLTFARKSEIRTFGWPIGVMLENKEEYRPRPTNDGIVANINIGKRESFDYWAWNGKGDFYLLKSIFEDSRKPNAIFFNTRIVRTTEAILYIRNMYKKLGASDSDKVHVRINYEGLSGRELSGSNHNRHIYERKISENECTSETVVSLGEISNDIISVIKSLVNPLFVLFDFFELSDEVYSDIINRFINGEVT